MADSVVLPPIELAQDRAQPHRSTSADLPNINSELPHLKQNRTTLERSHVVGTKSTKETLSAGWTQLRVNPLENDEDQRTKVEWENQIAKHILSMFASTHSMKNAAESSSLLDFVDVDKGAAGRSRKPTGSSSSRGSTLASSSVDRLPPTLQEEDEAEDEAEGEGEENYGGTSRRHKKTKRRTKKTLRRTEEEEAVPEEDPRVRIAAQVISRVKREAKALQQAGGPVHISEAQAQDNADEQRKEKQKGKFVAKEKKEKDKFRITNTITTKDGREVVVRGSPRCFAIWFVSTGDVYANWTALPGGTRLQAHLNSLSEARRYSDYLGILEATLTEMFRFELYGEEDFELGSFGISSGAKGAKGDISNNKRKKKPKQAAREVEQAVRVKDDDSVSFNGAVSGFDQRDSEAQQQREVLPEAELLQHWCQLILTSVAMGILYLENKDPDAAMQLFKRAEEWATNDLFIKNKQQRKGLRAHVHDAIAYFFFKRHRSIAALGYSKQAMELYEGADNMDGVGTCLLHIAAVHSQVGDFKEAHRQLFQFLAMVESGRLADVDATPKQLCLVAIGYHNLAVVQLKLAMPDLACKNSQNARKIARLCLASSNRWIDTFQYTHEIAVADLKYELVSKRAADLTPEQLALVAGLSEALFDPLADS
ncbi:hypothetical protein B484DRAFT_421583 [Ochromonadaceae sp. CCMP2298]|nr:hypothetical protein B484DRAFT_421583 [Ochromonadaceae sp. CCMP2298]